jgi:TRAP-type mannitol/chloroaromatic compound transport system permease small subunit
MSVLYAFMRGITRLNEWIGRIVAYLIVPIFIFLLAEVFLRYLMGSPAVWTNEFSQLLFGVYAIMAGGYLMAHDGHASVDLLHSKLPVRLRAVIDILTSVVFFIFVGALLYFGWSLAEESMETWERSRSAWNPYIWPFKLMIPAAAFLLLLQGIVKLLQDILIAMGKRPPAMLPPADTEEQEA